MHSYLLTSRSTFHSASGMAEAQAVPVCPPARQKSEVFLLLSAHGWRWSEAQLYEVVEWLSKEDVVSEIDLDGLEVTQLAGAEHIEEEVLEYLKGCCQASHTCTCTFSLA